MRMQYIYFVATFLGMNIATLKGGGLFGKNLHDPKPYIEMLDSGEMKEGDTLLGLPGVKPIGWFNSDDGEQVFNHYFYWDGKTTYLNLYTADGRLFSATLLRLKGSQERVYFHDSALFDRYVKTRMGKIQNQRSNDGHQE